MVSLGLQALAEDVVHLDVITLSDAMRRARQRVGPVLTSNAAYQRTKAQAKFARGARLPTVDLQGGAGVLYVNQPYLPDTPRFESTAARVASSLSADWVAADGARTNSIAAADARSEAQAAAVADSEQQAMSNAAKAYVEAVAARELVEDVQLTIERRAGQLTVIRTLVQTGLRPDVDALRAEIDLKSARHALQIANLDADAAAASLASAVGESPTLLVHPDTFADSNLPAARGPKEAAEVALQRRPELRELEGTRAAAESDNLSDRRARWPKVGVAAGGTAEHREILTGTGIRGGIYAASAALYLRWTVVHPTISYAAGVSTAAAAEAGKRLASMRMTVENQGVAAAYEVQRAQVTVAQAEERLEDAIRTRDVQRNRYRGGLASLLELLDAENLEQNARRQSILALRDERLARIRLLGACGEIETLLR